MAWTIQVEIAFTTQPMSASPSWTDVTAYVLHKDKVAISFGRPDEFSEVQPSTLAITLNNRDGRFTPFNTSGAYYPNVKVGKRIRVRVTRSAVTYTRFDGHINAFPTTWPSGRTGYAEVHLTATDRTGRLGDTGELRSMVEEEILFDDPAVYFPLAEPSGATTAASIAAPMVGNAEIGQVGTGGTLEFAAGTGPGVDGLSAPIFTFVDRVNGKYLEADLTTSIGTTLAVSLECWFATEHDVGINDVPICSLLTPNGTGSVNLLLGSSQQLTWEYIQNGAVVANNQGATIGLNDGRNHHAALTLSHNGGATVTVKLYADGVEDYSGTFTPPHINLQVFSHVEMGGAPLAGAFGGSVTGAVYNGTLSHVAAYSSVLSAATVLRHYNAGANGLAGERTDQRIGRIADWIGLPSGDRSFDTGDSTVGAQQTSGRQPIDVMNEVATTEQGVVFFAAGVLTFHDRSRRFDLASAATITAAQMANDLEFPGDDTGMQNDVTVTRAGGTEQRAVNQTSIDDYGLRRDSISICADTDNQAESLANWRVYNYADPTTRVPNVTAHLHRLESSASSLVTSLLQATIGTKLTLGSLPSQAPATSLDVFVEGWTETFDQRWWTITFNTSPGDVATAWKLGTSGFSELGTTTILGP